MHARALGPSVALTLAVAVLGSCTGGTTVASTAGDRSDPVGSDSVSVGQVDPSASGADLVEPESRTAPAWSLDHLSADGRTITVSIAQPCGGRYEAPRVEVAEDATEVQLLVTVYEARPSSGCEALQAPLPFDVALGSPLGTRSVIDAAAPDRALKWTVAPGAVRAAFRIEAEPGAIDPSLDPTLLVALGLDELQVPIPLDQLSDGELLPVPLVLEPASSYDAVLGFLDRLPLVPGSVRGSVRARIPDWDPSVSDQTLVLTLHPGAITGSGRAATAHPAQMTMSWEA